MTSVAPVDAVAPAPPRETHRAPVDYGAAVSHRDMVQEKLRVDPASLAHKKRPPADVRSSDPRREGYEVEDRERAGQYVDIEA